MFRPSSSDPVAEAYYAAYEAYTALRNPDEWTPEANEARIAAGLAHRSALAALQQAVEPGNPEIWHAMAHACAHRVRFETPEEAIQRFRETAALRRLRHKPAVEMDGPTETDESGEGEAARLVWERKAADAGLPAAMVSLAILFRRQDHQSPEAIAWLQRAAALNYASAMVFLGFAFRDGHGVSQDFQTAAEWFQKAVAAGDSHALVHVGKVFALYLGEHAKGLTWFLRAAEAGHREAFIYLADLYGDRSSPVHNPGEALLWYHRVAESGGSGSAARAMLELSDRYRDGIGAAADRTKAREWLVNHIASLPANSRRIKTAKKELADFDASLF